MVGQSRINCSSEVYTDPATWRLSRNYLEQQIRILRVQLDELKVIRKHLRAMRPPGAPVGQPIARQPGPKAKHKDSKLFDWSAPPSRQTAPSTVQSTAQKQPQRRPKPHLPGLPKESAEEEDDEDADDTDDTDDDDDDSGPVETIEVTIYDNRKIKYGPVSLFSPAGVSPRGQSEIVRR